MKFIGSINLPTALEIIGALLLIYIFIYKPLKILLSWLSNNCSNAWKRILNPGPKDYAVITGASDGIGLEYAKNLAQLGYKLMLISRTEEKLKKVAREIQDQYPQCQKIEILAVDFSRTDIYDRIQEKLSSIPGRIHVLVNNVGAGNGKPDYFASFSGEAHHRLITTNIVSTTRMSEIVLKIMTSRQESIKTSKSKVNGVIINISSQLGLSEMPLVSSYSASKAYINYLSACLSAEYASHGILIQTVTPGLVETKLIKGMENPSMSVPVQDYVHYALRTVGTERVTSGHPKHKRMAAMSRIIADLIGERLFMKLKFGMMKKMAGKADS